MYTVDKELNTIQSKVVEGESNTIAIKQRLSSSRGLYCACAREQRTINVKNAKGDSRFDDSYDKMTGNSVYQNQ